MSYYFYFMNKKAIEIKNLNFSYPDSTIALKNISFSVLSGETCGIIGPNGAGKSTLLLHLNGIFRGNGQVIIFGEKIQKNNLKEIRSKVGVVFQDPNDQLFMPTIFDDIAFGPLNFGMKQEEINRKVNKILKNMGLEDLEKKPSHHLSSGERKKASLATVLVLEPEILIFDEPTVSLDPGTRRMFIDLFKEIKGTKIIASHDIDMIYETCSRIILMDNGKIIKEGSTYNILKNEKLLKNHNLEVPISILNLNKL